MTTFFMRFSNKPSALVITQSTSLWCNKIQPLYYNGISAIQFGFKGSFKQCYIISHPSAGFVAQKGKDNSIIRKR